MPSDLTLGGSATVRQLNLAAGGAISIGGTAGVISSGYQWPPRPVYEYAGGGKLTVAGVATTRRVQFFYTSTGRLQLGGTSPVTKGFLSGVGSGKVTLGGTSLVQKGFFTVSSSGGITASGQVDKPKFAIPFVGRGGLTLGLSSTDTSVVLAFSVSRTFSWNVQNTFDVGLDVLWNITPSTTYYYEVSGVSNPIDLGSDCVDYPSGQAFLQILTATSVDELCSKFSDANPDDVLQINSVRRFTRPVFKSEIARDAALGITYDCPEWIEETYSSIPNCLKYSLTESLYVKMASRVSVQENFYVPVVSGGLTLSGKASIGSLEQKASGGLKTGGTADVKGSVIKYVPTQYNISLGGQARVISPIGHYAGTGSLSIGGQAAVVSPVGTYVGQGGLTLSTDSNNIVRYSYTANNGSIFLSGNASVRAANYHYHVGDKWQNLGAYNNDFNDDYDIEGEYLTFEPDSYITGGLTVGSGPYYLKMNYFQTAGTGTVTIGGQASLRHYQYVSNGGILLNGTALTSIKNIVAYTGIGGITAIGSGNSRIKISRIATGGLIASSSVNVSSQAFSYTSTGKITLAGNAYLPNIDLGVFNVPLTSLTSLLLLESIFPEDIISQELTVPSEDIITNCGCGPLPLILRFKHNIFNSNSIKNFLTRNGIAIPTDFSLFYYKADHAWRTNIHWQGVSSDGVSKERWNFLIEWACVNEINGIELDISMWKFSMAITQVDGETGENEQTRIVYSFGIDAACLENTLDFTFDVNTQRGGTVTASVPFVMENPIFIDGAKLFKTRYWLTHPEVTFSITEIPETQSSPTYDISPIFPTEPLISNN